MDEQSNGLDQAGGQEPPGLAPDGRRSEGDHGGDEHECDTAQEERPARQRGHAERAQRDEPGHVGEALRHHDGRREAHRRADEVADQDGLQHLAELSGRDRHREPGEEDPEARLPGQRDVRGSRGSSATSRSAEPSSRGPPGRSRGPSLQRNRASASIVAERFAVAASPSATAAPSAIAIRRLRSEAGRRHRGGLEHRTPSTVNRAAAPGRRLRRWPRRPRRAPSPPPGGPPATARGRHPSGPPALPARSTRPSGGSGP